MTPEEAIDRLCGREVVAVTRAQMEFVKELHAKCLSQDIPAAMRRPPEPGG